MEDNQQQIGTGTEVATLRGGNRTATADSQQEIRGNQGNTSPMPPTPESNESLEVGCDEDLPQLADIDKKEKTRAYYRAYYAKNKEKYYQTVMKYNKTPKGIAAHKRSINRLKETQPNYYSNYMKQRRAKCKAEGLCISCFKKLSQTGRASCEECLARTKQKVIEHNTRKKEALNGILS